MAHTFQEPNLMWADRVGSAVAVDSRGDRSRTTLSADPVAMILGDLSRSTAVVPMP